MATVLKWLDVRAIPQPKCAALILGRLDYGGANAECLPAVVDRLIELTGTSVRRANSIETKRNGIEALSILASSASNLPPLLARILDGFTDYTLDQRGDVGSWVRLASIAAVERNFSLFESTRDCAVSELLKQAVEKLDNVREAAGRTLGTISGRRPDLWEALKTDDLNQWRHITWASERVFPFLEVNEYRPTLVEGVVLGLTPHTNSGAFVDYALALPTFPTGPTGWALTTLLQDLIDLGKRSFSANRIFIPVLGAVNTLLESGGLEELEADPRGGQVLRQILLLASRAVPQVKSAPRLTASLRTVVLLLAFPSIASPASSKVALFLGHSLAWLRQSAAEELYTAAPWDDSEANVDELVELLAETPWADPLDSVSERLERATELLAVVFGGKR